MRNLRSVVCGAAIGCAAAGLGAAALAPGTAMAACTAGVHSYGSAQARTFCGPASATIHIAGKTSTLKGGECERTSQYLSVNIGTTVLGTTSKTSPNYFGLDVGKTLGGGTPATHDGTYKAFALTWVISDKHDSSINATVTLKNGRTSGAFSGPLITGGSASGTFSCG